MASNKFNIPLKGIVNNEGNVYELTCAAITRAGQLSVVGGSTVDSCDGKIVSAALTEVVDKIVSYKNEEE